jgi:hypothetical protein
MQKSFTEYRKRKNIPLESMETVFGKHSQKSVTESEYKILSNKEHDELHDSHVPFNAAGTEPDHMKAVTDYTRDSTGMNGYLHNHHTKSNKADIHEKPVKDLTELLNKHKTKNPIDVYTGVLYSPAKHFDKVDGKVPESKTVHLPAFTSTTTARRIAEQFARGHTHENDANHGVNTEYGNRHILKIHVPAGSSAASVKDISSMGPGEKEVLLNRGHNIEIHHKPEYIGGNVYQWNAKIVSHTPDKL